MCCKISRRAAITEAGFRDFRAQTETAVKVKVTQKREGMRLKSKAIQAALATGGLLITLGILFGQEPAKKPSSYSPVVIQEDFASVGARMSAAKPAIMQRQKALLDERYDLSRPSGQGVTMSRGKAVQEGVRVKLRAGTTWDRLAEMSPDEIRDKDVFPLGFMPLPHPNHPEGGMVFPKFHIDEIKKQEGARSDPLRPRLRSARPPPAGVSAGHLSDHAA